jgi:hypothetical protein
MLWKILSALAAIALAVGLWFAYQDQLAIKVEMDLAKRSRDNLKATEAKIVEATEFKARREKEVADLEKQRDDLKIEVTKVATDTEQKLAEIEVIKKNLEEVTKQLVQLEDQIRKAGNIKQLLAQVDDLTKQKQAKEAEIANQQQQLALAEQKLASLSGEVTKMQELDKRQRSGVVDPALTAKVSQPFPDLGFVILNKGNLGGVFANAMLEVKRGNDVVAKLKVRDVEQSQSVADLVPGSLASGTFIRSGDLVVPSKVQPKEMPETPSTPATPAPGAPAPAAPAGDPFGAGGMASPTPAPAPAPAAPMGADPFAPAPAGGMAPAPAPAPAAPMGADPFAPAPPAGGMAPAPAGGAAPAGGTSAMPSTADPFAPAPPK